MAIPSCARGFPSFECRSDPDFSGRIPRPEIPTSGRRFTSKVNLVSRGLSANGLSSSLIYRFPPNFVRQLSTKARRNCSNIGVAQIVAASWSNNQPPASSSTPAAAKAVDAAAAAASAALAASIEIPTGVEEEVVAAVESGDSVEKCVQFEGLANAKYSSFLTSDGSIAIHAGMC